jgi:hypothetical protein
LFGCLTLARFKRRTSAWLFGSGVIAVSAVARLGQLWPPVQALGLDRAAPLAVGLAVVPAAHAVTAWEWFPVGRLFAAVTAGLPLAIATTDGEWGRCLDLAFDPVDTGLTTGQQNLVAAIRQHTTPEARILLEDPDSPQPGWNWTALLPRLSDRAFIGGLDGDACVDLSYCGLRRGRLNGRPLADLTDAELAELCRVYNVGWVVARYKDSIARWKAWGAVTELGRYEDNGEVVLLAIDRPRSFVLSGAAATVHADRRQIVLTDVVANADGELLLSFHHQQGMQVTPPPVWIDEAVDPNDPTKFLRLRLPPGRSVARIVIRWVP